MNLSAIWSILFKDISITKKVYTSFFWITIITLVYSFQGYNYVSVSRTDTYNIEVASKTRMLSQRLLQLAYASSNADPVIANKAKEELSNTLRDLSAIYSLLKSGGIFEKSDHLPEKLVPIKDEKIRKKLEEVESTFNEHKKLCEAIIHGTPDSPELKSALLHLQSLGMDDTLFSSNVDLCNLYFANSQSHCSTFMWLFPIFFGVGITVIILNFFLLQKFIVGPITKIAQAAHQVEMGNISTSVEHENNDELGMIVGSINTLASNLRKAAEFTVKIGQGDFSAKYDVVVAEGIDEKNNLSAALLNMRDRLRDVAEEDKKRNWATEGQAKFGEILRNSSNDIKTLGDEIISNLVRYLNANQGSLFLVNDTEKEQAFLELMSCYAWNKKKFVTKSIELGEGLAGQAWQEGSSLYVTDVPEGYVEITSGLGRATPRSILVTPLKINEDIFGVVELASFQAFASHEIAFVEKLGESIASTISGVKVNERTKKLLEESQQFTEELKTQEEETRQNLEELSATQEEMERRERELKTKMEELEQIKEELLREKHNEQ